MLTPTILRQGKYNSSDLEKLKSSYRIDEFKDLYADQLIELYEIAHPDKASQIHTHNQSSISEDQCKGDWIYLPWSQVLIHTIEEQDLFKLRTNRNRLLITSQEQAALYESCIGFAGLSIGSHYATSIIYNGIASTVKLADMDVLSTTNLNRIKAKLEDVGKLKIEMIAQQVYEINPYQNIIPFEHGINDQSIDNFFTGERKAQIVFEAVDDFKLKILLRLKARHHRVPVIMITNLGDSILIDVERYDLNSKLELFNGKIGNTPEEILKKEITEQDKIKYALQIVSSEYTPARAVATLNEIGKSVVGRPQLYSTVSMGGGIAAYLAKRIILGWELPSGRYQFSLDAVFGVNEPDVEKKQDLLDRLMGGAN